MTRYVSNPSAALMSSFSPFAAAQSTVGNQRLSLVSVRRKTTSCASTIASSASTSARTRSFSRSPLTTCPGMGMLSRTPSASTPGKIRRSASAAHCAFGRPPSAQSACSKRLCRAGLE